MRSYLWGEIKDWLLTDEFGGHSGIKGPGAWMR